MKKIIFVLALVLSFGLLASCSHTFNVKDIEYTEYKYACDVVGTITTTNTYTHKVGGKLVTETEVTTYSLAGVPSQSDISYTEYENRNKVVYELKGSKVVELKYSWTDGTNSTKVESVANNKYEVTKIIDGVTTTADYTEDEVEVMFEGDFPTDKRVTEEYDITVYTYGEDNAAYVFGRSTDSYGTEKDLLVSFVEEDGVYTLYGDVVTYTNKTETTSEETKVTYDVVYTVK